MQETANQKETVSYKNFLIEPRLDHVSNPDGTEGWQPRGLLRDAATGNYASPFFDYDEQYLDRKDALERTYTGGRLAIDELVGA